MIRLAKGLLPVAALAGLLFTTAHDNAAQAAAKCVKGDRKPPYTIGWANIYSVPTWMKQTQGTIEDIFNDPHYQARNSIVAAPDDNMGTVAMAAVVPRMSATPGAVRHAGRNVGQDTRQVLRDVLEDPLHGLSVQRAVGGVLEAILGSPERVFAVGGGLVVQRPRVHRTASPLDGHIHVEIGVELRQGRCASQTAVGGMEPAVGFFAAAQDVLGQSADPAQPEQAVGFLGREALLRIGGRHRDGRQDERGRGHEMLR